MRSRTHPDLRGRCRSCYVREAHCICADVPRVHNGTHVLVIRHAFEASKTTNTARIALLALQRASLVDYRPRSPPDVGSVLAPFKRPWLVYPTDSGAAPKGPPPDALVVLDGTWDQTRHMMRRQSALLRLPKLGLLDAVASARLRRAPSPHARSTLEAIASALELTDGEAVARPLHALHRAFVERTLTARGAAASP